MNKINLYLEPIFSLDEIITQEKQLREKKGVLDARETLANN